MRYDVLISEEQEFTTATDEEFLHLWRYKVTVCEDGICQFGFEPLVEFKLLPTEVVLHRLKGRDLVRVRRHVLAVITLVRVVNVRFLGNLSYCEGFLERKKDRREILICLRQEGPMRFHCVDLRC